jgi:archaellum biogenesis ATPase FlaH
MEDLDDDNEELDKLFGDEVNDMFTAPEEEFYSSWSTDTDPEELPLYPTDRPVAEKSVPTDPMWHPYRSDLAGTACEEPAEKRYPWPLYTAADALRPAPPIPWTVKGLITRGSLVVVAGAPGSKKTFCLQNLAACVADGKPWLGLKTTQGNVLLIDSESGERRLNFRLSRILKGENCCEDIPLKYISSKRIDLQNPSDTDGLREIIQGEGIDLIIIDSLIGVIPNADENRGTDMADVMTILGTIAEETDTTIILIHHTNKKGFGMGSIRIESFCDLYMMVTSNRNSPIIKFQSIKCRDFEPFEMYAQIHFEPDMVWLEPAEKPVAKSKKLINQEKVLEALKKLGPSPVVARTILAALGEAEISLEDVNDALRDLRAAGKIESQSLGPGKKSIHKIKSA